jgi:Tripartite ATP-independent periplasmic transporter, DctM component
VNMQTSFMHPPFGFALFYLRGIADTLHKEGRIPERIKSTDIYLGAIPWVIMQLILVVIVIFFPQTVTAFLDKDVVVDIDKVSIEIPSNTEEGKTTDASAIPSTLDAAKKDAADAASADDIMKSLGGGDKKP